jgi:hypothetical protein
MRAHTVHNVLGPAAMTRTLGRSALATAAMAVSLLGGAMHAYPGGTHWDRAAPGHDFWRNYLCDLARTVALNGAPNPLGSALARAAMASLTVTIGLFFWLLSARARARARVRAGIRGLGSVAAGGALVVASLPSDRFGDAHAAAIVVAGTAGLLGATLATACVAATPVDALLGAVTLVFAAVAFALYVWQLVVPGPGPVAGAVSERLALLALLAWMGVTFVRPERAYGSR